MNLNLEDDQDIVDEAEGTLEIFQKAIDSDECSVQRKAI
jgi:hypothetical protein